MKYILPRSNAKTTSHIEKKKKHIYTDFPVWDSHGGHGYLWWQQLVELEKLHPAADRASWIYGQWQWCELSSSSIPPLLWSVWILLVISKEPHRCDVWVCFVGPTSMYWDFSSKVVRYSAKGFALKMSSDTLKASNKNSKGPKGFFWGFFAK